jgi:hypothetical protein
MKRNQKTTPSNGYKNYFGKATRMEDTYIARIDIINHCEAELLELRSIVTKPTFASDLKLQNKAVLIARGIDLKIRAIYAQDPQTASELILEIRGLLEQYGGQYNKQTIDLNVGITSILSPDEIKKPEDAGL